MVDGMASFEPDVNLDDDGYDQNQHASQQFIQEEMGSQEARARTTDRRARAGGLRLQHIRSKDPANATRRPDARVEPPDMKLTLTTCSHRAVQRRARTTRLPE